MAQILWQIGHVQGGGGRAQVLGQFGGIQLVSGKALLVGYMWFQDDPGDLYL